MVTKVCNVVEFWFTYEHKDYCCSCWKQLLGISDDMFEEAWEYHQSKILPIHRNTGHSTLAPKYQYLLAVIHNFIQGSCDKMPERNEYHLPPTYTKEFAYSTIMTQIFTDPLNPLKIESKNFWKFFRKHWPQVKWPKEMDYGWNR